MKLRFEASPNQYAVRVYDDEGHPDNYIASAIVRTYGDRGWMSNITGAGFYQALQEHLAPLMDQLNVKTLEGYMTPAHARLVKIVLAKTGAGTLHISHYGEMAGRRMPWVIISAAERQQ